LRRARATGNCRPFPQLVRPCVVAELREMLKLPRSGVGNPGSWAPGSGPRVGRSRSARPAPRMIPISAADCRRLPALPEHIRDVFGSTSAAPASYCRNGGAPPVIAAIKALCFFGFFRESETCHSDRTEAVHAGNTAPRNRVGGNRRNTRGRILEFE